MRRFAWLLLWAALYTFLGLPVIHAALPVTFNKATPADTDPVSQGATKIRNLTLAIEDLFGIPDNTAISSAIGSINATGAVTWATAPTVQTMTTPGFVKNLGASTNQDVQPFPCLITQGCTGVSGTPQNGQFLIGNGSGYSLAHIQPGTGLTSTNGAGTFSLSTTAKYAVIADQKAAGTDGGTFTSGAWRTRTINTELYDPDNIVSINGANTQFTLPAGTYRVHWSAVAHAVNRHASRLFNISTNSVVASGMNSAASNAGNIQMPSDGWARFTIANSSVFEVQHQCVTTEATDGFGIAMPFTVAFEQYLTVEIVKE